MDNERRCSPRISVTRTVKITSSETTNTGKMLDISDCGTGLVCESAIELEKEIELSFSLPGFDQQNTLNLSARVHHATPVNTKYLIGLQFINLSPHSQLVIKEFSKFHKRFSA